MEIVNESSEKEKGSSLSNTVNVPQTRYYKLKIATEDYSEKELKRIKKMVDSHGRTVSSKMNNSPNLNRGWPNLPDDLIINKTDFLSIHQKIPQIVYLYNIKEQFLFNELEHNPQKMQITNNKQEFYMENAFLELNNENKVLEQLENYLLYGKQPKGNKFVINETPAVLQYAGINPLEIEFSTSVINKAKKIHKMTNDEILNTVKKIADPLLVFDSDKNKTENKKDSILLITDEEVLAENKPSAVSMNVDANETNNRYKINAITSIHGRSLIARNGINIMEEWKNKGLLKYADDKKISSLAKAVSQGEPDIQEQFLLPLATLDIENIPCKSDFVNHQEKVQDISNIATELVLEKLKAANINVITDQNEMQAVLDAGIEVQKMAAHYGTNQNIENEESFNGYGVYVLSVNEENARNLGIKIAAKKYGNSFYINNQPLQEFLQERSFSPYWQSVISQVENPSNETLLHSVMTSDVKGNPVLLKEQNQLSTLCGLNLINYKREQTYLYSVEIPDNDGTNYLYYDKTIGLESAERINEELSKLGTNWKVSRNDTGNSVYFNILSNKVFNSQKHASEFLQKIGYVGMETSTENYIIFDDREMNINNRVQYMITENGELYGFAYNGQIYADKNLMNSNVLAHEYTHLWDNYTKNQNHKLWERGKNVFKQTSIWNEVLNDPSYQNIRNNEDEILSECHARICGKFAQSVLERIARENGENAKNAVIDWNKEVETFVAKEFGFVPELGNENYISDSVKNEYMKEFLSAPMKDLMNGVGFEKNREKEALSFADAQKLYPNIVDLSEEFNNPAPNEKQVLETLRSMIGEVYATATEDKFITIYNSREKNEHVIKGDNYFHDNNKTRKTNRRLSNNVEKLIKNAEFIEAELSSPQKNKDYLLGMHNYEVPVFVNGHGFMVKLEGEVIKNGFRLQPVAHDDEKTLTSEAQLKTSEFSPGNEVLQKILTSEDNHDNNENLLKLQAAKVSNLYVVRKQRPLFKIENEHNENESRIEYEISKEGDLIQKDIHLFGEKKALAPNESQVMGLFSDESHPLPKNNIQSSESFVKNIQKLEISSKKDNSDYPDPIEALEEFYNTPQNPPTEEDIENEKILHDKYIQQELDKIVEDLQVNGGLSEERMDADLETQDASENYDEAILSEEKEEVVLTFNDANGNPHYPQEIISILENFQKVEPAKWNVPAEEKTAVFHLIQLAEIDKNDFENSLAKLQEYMITEEFKREEKNYSEIFTPILLTSLGQDFDEATHTFSSEKFSYKFSTDELKEEVPVKKGEIKSILDNDFTGGNVKLTKDFQNELIEKGLVKPEEKFVLINEVEAVAHGTKIKEGEPFVILTVPVENDGKKEFVQTKYYHVSALEEPQKILSENKNEELTAEEKKIIFGETKIPEFAMITQNGLKTFKNMITDSYEESSKTYLLRSEDGSQEVRISENTMNILSSEEYSKKAAGYTQNTKTYEKLVETQYNDYFNLRSNTANNFSHNLSVFCRKEANSPLDALKIAGSIISQMPPEEKRKTKKLLNLLKKDGQTVNELLVETYHEAIKEVPLNENYLNNNRYDKIIARPMYDTVSTKGQKIDSDYNLKIGDDVEISFKVNKNAGSKFSLRKENLYQKCTIISASKEGNMVTLMDGNKSFYDVPRDTFLKEYAKKQKVENKIEKKVHRQQAMKIEIGR